MKIGYDAKRIFHNQTGLGNYCRDMVRILSEYYTEHQYLLYNPRPGKVNRLEPDGTKIIERRPERWIWRVLNGLWRQGPMLNQVKHDGVSIFHGLSGELPRGIANTDIKAVVTIHDLIFVTHPHLYKTIDRKIYFNKFKYAAGNADVVVAISEYTKYQIIKYLNTDPTKIKVVYQTCHSYFKSPRPSELLKSTKIKYGIPDRFIINVGTIEERKNLFSLIKAVVNTDHHIVVIGRRTNYYSDIVDYIDSNNMATRIHFLEDILLEELAAIYQLADLMVYTSKVEGFGIPIIESLYTSTPVICHNKGVFSEAAGPNSLYTDMANPEAIKLLINKVWDNQELKDQMISDGLEYVRRFDDKVIADKMMSIYHSLLD